MDFSRLMDTPPWATPWAILLFPAILSARGAIGGLFTGRLSTALHIGTIEPTLTKNTRQFHLLLYAIVILTLASSVIMGLTASMFAIFLFGAKAAEVPAILTVSVTTISLSLVLISPMTFAISILSFKKGLDPDVVVYPVVSTVADILVTICYVTVLDVFYSSHLVRILFGIFDLVFLFLGFYILHNNYRDKEFLRTTRESLVTFISVAFIVNISGIVLGKISQTIGARPEVYAVYPALIDTVGDVGSIVGSTATTKLALGTIESSFTSIRHHLTEIGWAWSASMVMFILYAFVASSMYGLTTWNEFSRFMAGLLATNVLAVSSIVLISFAIAISTQKRGLDPDNFVIPIESSLSDTITTISLLIAIAYA